MVKLKVLVIEDNDLNMKLMRAIFQTTDYRVVTAEDGKTGLKKARENRPDLILMDVGLPDMSGLDAVRILKADPELKKVPIIAVTGYAMGEDEVNAYDAGCDDYVSKPINIQILLQKITAVLDSKTKNACDRIKR